MVGLWAAAAAPAAIADALAPFRSLDPALAARLVELDPARVSATDVRDVLERVPAPRIFLLQGSVAFISMAPFAQFLIAMGYPEARIADPADGEVSRSSFGDSAALAGEVAGQYERDGMMPMLIGHSQGGMQVIRVLYELAGDFHPEIDVVDPVTGAALARTTIVDPLTGRERPVVGLKVAYAAALATGKTMRVLLGQWAMIPRLRRIPDTADTFTGFTIPGDLIAGTFGAADPYRPLGTAQVRNVMLPSSYSHIGLPLAAHLAADPVTRSWIERYDPANPAALPDALGVDTTNLLHAADIWASVKRTWCVEAQRALRAAQDET